MISLIKSHLFFSSCINIILICWLISTSYKTRSLSIRGIYLMALTTNIGSTCWTLGSFHSHSTFTNSIRMTIWTLIPMSSFQSNRIDNHIIKCFVSLQNIFVSSKVCLDLIQLIFTHNESILSKLLDCLFKSRIIFTQSLTFSYLGDNIK